MIARRLGSAIALNTSVVVAARAMPDYIPVSEYVKRELEDVPQILTWAMKAVVGGAS
jgi:hypothetical protein